MHVHVYILALPLVDFILLDSQANGGSGAALDLIRRLDRCVYRFDHSYELRCREP
jgi:hypothetical protein